MPRARQRRYPLPPRSGTVDRLLNGDPVGAEHRDLATVLSAAAAAGRPAELRGRSAALAAFQAAAELPVTQPEQPSKLRSALVRMLTVKTALLATLLVATGGVALAAGTGVFSRPPSNHAEVQQPASPSPAPPSPAPLSPSASPTPAAPPPTTTSPSRSPQATRTAVVTESTPPSLVVLCRAYLAEIIRSATSGHDGGASSNAGIDDPAFGVLIIEAGSRAAVVAFCTVVLSTAPNPDGTGGPPIVGPHDSHGTLPGRRSTH